MADVKMTLKPNGPILVEGKFDLIDSQGNAIALDPNKPAFALCRCGLSSRKPFCDGTHSRECWQEVNKIG